MVAGCINHQPFDIIDELTIRQGHPNHGLPASSAICSDERVLGEKMIRIVATALLILGLVAQPLMAAMPDSMPISHASSAMSMHHSNPDVGMADHGSMGSDQSSGAPCHETIAKDTSQMPCTDCDSDCVGGSCASACSLGTVAALNQINLRFERLSAVRVVGTSAALVQELPSRIFHPPKHA
jgi:hypothetical protein